MALVRGAVTSEVVRPTIFPSRLAYEGLTQVSYSELLRTTPYYSGATPELIRSCTVLLCVTPSYSVLLRSYSDTVRSYSELFRVIPGYCDFLRTTPSYFPW